VDSLMPCIIESQLVTKQAEVVWLKPVV